MNERYTFIDESGDLGLGGSKYFVITAILADKPKQFNRIIEEKKDLTCQKFIPFMKDGLIAVGAQPYDAFKQAIDAELAE